MTLVAGIDSSTQSCKVLVCDADTGTVVRQGKASHPDGTEVHPEHWWRALEEACTQAGGLADVAAVAVGGQQHGLVALDSDGAAIRPALLWNDTRSAQAAGDLVTELGGRRPWAEAVGSVPVASLTVSKLRWLADAEPDSVARLAAVALPHDWLTSRLLSAGAETGAVALEALVTDRSDASGTGYYDAVAGAYRRDLVALALRCSSDQASELVLPRVASAGEAVGSAAHGVGGLKGNAVVGPGCGDNAGAALGLGLTVRSSSVSIGTSGVVASVSDTPTHDVSGLVTGFSDATGRYLPLACTLNGSRVLDSTAALLGVAHAGLSALALAAEPGSGGLTLVPYLEGERTPNLPDATGALFGVTMRSFSRENLARAAVEGLLCLLAEGMDAVRALGIPIDEVTLVGGGAQSEAVRRIAPEVFGVPVRVPPPGEYVARGAARQAAWVLRGGSEPPEWPLDDVLTFETAHRPEVLAAYRAVRPWPEQGEEA
ncbi:MAG: xylulokinase [Dermatophilus congolensis]|nr:xylulokinase [Dermatophilus congolensis]